MRILLLRRYFWNPLVLLSTVWSFELAGVFGAEIAGAKVTLINYRGPATLSVSVLGNRELAVEVDPHGDERVLDLSVVLPASAEGRWAADMVVVDSTGRPLLVRRSGTEWHKLIVRIPPKKATYFVRTAEPPNVPPIFSERDREAEDLTTGLKVTVLRWHDGRKAALSIRFDDSHPSHLSKAIPILREFGFRGTFMVCPGLPDFVEHLAEWKAVASRGDQELANHTLHHRGASGDEEMETEIGQAAKAIRDLFSGKSRLLALNLGGGTTWETTRPLRYYLDKYHLFDASAGSLGMDDVYGDRVTAFREHLRRHIERGLWCRIHFHSIGKGAASSELTLRDVLAIAKAHENDLWIAGMADIYKYQTERQATKLWLSAESPQQVYLRLFCGTNPEWYDQPLTMEMVLPPSWPLSSIRVTRVNPRPETVLAAGP